MTIWHRRRKLSDSDLDALLERTRNNYITRRDATYDFEAGLADVYGRVEGRRRRVSAEQGRIDSPTPASDESAVQAVCDHIEMLDALLGAVTEPVDGPALPASYFGMARVYLLQLRRGLTARKLTQDDAADLIRSIEHDLGEADDALRRQHGLSLDEALSERIGELREVKADMGNQMRVLHQSVMKLFDHVDDNEPRTPILQP